MALRGRSRKTEGILSLGVIVVLLAALSLVFWSKWRVEVPADAVMVNQASAETFALALGVDRALAERLVAQRNQAGGFESSDQILDVALFSRADAERLAAALALSHLDPQSATAGQLAALLRIQPVFARRLVAYRDSGGQGPEVRGQGAAFAGPRRLTPGLWRAPLLDPQATRPLLRRFLIRRPADVFRHFWIGAALLFAAVFLVPPWLRARVEGDPFLVPLALLLSGLGVVMLFSIKDPLRDGPAYEHHLLGIGAALLVMILFARLAPAARLRIRSYQYVWVFAAALLVVALYVFGNGPEGVKLNLFHVQPVEIIKLLLVFFLASYLGDRAGLIADTSKRWTPPQFQEVKRANGRPTVAFALPRLQDIGPILVMYGFALTLFFVIKDLGPGALMFATFVAVLYLTTGRGSFVLLGLALLIAGGLLGYWRHIGVFPTRVDMWLNPFANAHPNGMQLGQGFWGVASGGLEGSGLGLGMPALIPRSGSDLAFISWAEETGLLGAWLTLTVYVVLVGRGLRIALRAASDFDRALAFGLTALLGLQTLLILCGVTGLLPLTGISLPYLSYGDSALIADFVIIGLLRGISAPPPGGLGRPAPRPEVLFAARRFALVFALALLGGVGLWRLGQFQLLRADEIATRLITTPDADKVARPHLNPRLLAMERDIARGSIYDRNGRVLATSRAAELLHLTPDVAAARRLIESRARLYPFGPATAHLVGTLDSAVGGPSGMEKGWNNDLRGFERYTDLLADYRRRSLPGFRPRRGRDLHLTLDAALQRDVEEILWQAASKLRDRRTGRPKDRAAFVLINPQSGDVLVAATIPTFDPNTLTPEQYQDYASGPDAGQEHRLINRAVVGVYPPGSTLKVATAACALENVPNALNFTADCNQVDRNLHWRAHGVTYARTVHDDKGDPDFGPLTLPTAFRLSSNIYFANLAVQIGAKPFHDTLEKKLNFRFTPPQEAFDRDLADIGYGQGRMLASPLEMARLAAAVANDGKMMTPRFVTSLTDPMGREKKEIRATTLLGQAMTAQTAATVRDLMHSVVTAGTARGVFDGLDFPVAGKTGTAQNTQYDREPHSWFIGFAPYSDRPGLSTAARYAFACIVENGGYGKRVAAVVCRDVLKKAF